MNNQPRMRRISFSYHGDQITLTGSTVVDGKVLPSQMIPEGAAGSWFEVRDVDGYVLYRRIGQHPLDGTLELHSAPNSGVPHRMVHGAIGKGTGELLIPDDPSAVAVVFFGPPRDVQGRSELAAAAVEISRFELN